MGLKGRLYFALVLVGDLLKACRLESAGERLSCPCPCVALAVSSFNLLSQWLVPNSTLLGTLGLSIAAHCCGLCWNAREAIQLANSA